MSEEKFKELYKNVKKEQIIEELYYKCEANKELYIGYERLNNIINELEKWLEYSINEHTNVIKNNNDIYWEIIQKETYVDRIMILNCVLDKIRELKGSDNNE